MLEKAKELRHSRYENVTLVPDMTKSQRRGEQKLRDKADRRKCAHSRGQRKEPEVAGGGQEGREAAHQSSGERGSLERQRRRQQSIQQRLEPTN